MAERMRSIRGIELCVESFGDESDPCVLLMMGAMASMLWWDERLCRALADRSLFVVRYDQRDVGRSSGGPPGVLGYDVDDLVLDALGVLDDLGVRRAHLVGMSLGGMLAQVAALRHPERVASITAIASGVWDDRPDLPGVDLAVVAHHQRANAVDWSDETAVRAFLVDGARLLTGGRRPFDETHAAALATAEIQRARSLRSRFNHAALAGAEDLYGRVGAIAAPVLVIHGTGDLVLPLPHAAALAEAVPGSRLITIEGGGHELHPLDWPLLVDAIAGHVKVAAGRVG